MRSMNKMSPSQKRKACTSGAFIFAYSISQYHYLRASERNRDALPRSPLFPHHAPAAARRHAARSCVHRSIRALLHNPLLLPPSCAPLPTIHIRLWPSAPTGPVWHPPPRLAAARRPGPALRPGGAGAQVRARDVPEDGHLRRGGGVVAVGGADVPEGAGRAVREPAGGGQCGGHHIRVREHGVRQLRAQVEAYAQAGERAPARGARRRGLVPRAPRRGRARPARHRGGRRGRAPRRRAGAAGVRARQHHRADHREQAGVRRAGRRVQQLQGDDRVAPHRHGAVQHQRLRAGAVVDGPAGRAGQAAPCPHPVRRTHHQASGGARRHGRGPRTGGPPGLRRQAPRQQGRRGRRDHHRDQHQGTHLRHVHGRHRHVVYHRGVGDGGDDEEPVHHGARAGGDGPRRRPGAPPGGVRHRRTPLPAGRLQGGHAPPPLHAAQPAALLLRGVRGRRLPRPGQHAAPRQHLGHRPRPGRVGGPPRVPTGAVPLRAGGEGGPDGELLRADPVRRWAEDLRRQARGHGVRAVLPGHAGTRVRVAAAGRRGEGGHGRDLRAGAAQGRAPQGRRHAASRAGRLRLRAARMDIDVTVSWEFGVDHQRGVHCVSMHKNQGLCSICAYYCMLSAISRVCAYANLARSCQCCYAECAIRAQ